MKQTNLLALAIAFFSLALHASALKYAGTPQVQTISGYTVQVYPEATVTSATGEVTKLKLTGHGLRRKALFGPFAVNVYYAAAYAEDPAAVKANPLEGLKASKAKVIQLTLLRNLSGQNDIRPSFEEALYKNGISTTKPSIEKLFDQFDFDLEGGQTILAIGTRTGNGTEEEMAIEAPQKTFSSKDDLLAVDFMSVWFGRYWDTEENTDANMRDLKKSLSGNN